MATRLGFGRVTMPPCVAGILFGPVRAVRARAPAQEARERRQQHGAVGRRGRREGGGGGGGERDHQLRQVQGEHRVHGDHARGHLPR